MRDFEGRPLRLESPNKGGSSGPYYGRRAVMALGGALAFGATYVALNLPDNDTKVRREVQRLAATYQVGNLTRGIYLDGQQTDRLNPAFQTPVEVKYLTSEGTALFVLNGHDEDPTRQFQFGSKEAFQARSVFTTSVSFSRRWLDMKTDRAKLFVMTKEAWHFPIITNFGGALLNSNRLLYGRENDFGVPLSDDEKKMILATNIVFSEEGRVLMDAAAYLALLEQLERIQGKDPQVDADLEGDTANALLKEAKRRNIDYKGVDANSQKLLSLGFNDNSPWKAMIKEPYFYNAFRGFRHPS